LAALMAQTEETGEMELMELMAVIPSVSLAENIQGLSRL
jgi:hypothetical protein